MTDDETAFLAAIAAAPDDEAPHKVYADWLDEHHRPDDAHYHRRWTVELRKAEEYLKAFTERPDCGGMDYHGLLRVVERYLNTGEQTGTTYHFPENEFVGGYGEEREAVGRDIHGFWRCVGLVLERDTTEPGSRQACPFACCEFSDLTNELYPAGKE